jgi:hypothetical protein
VLGTVGVTKVQSWHFIIGAETPQSPTQPQFRGREKVVRNCKSVVEDVFLDRPATSSISNSLLLISPTPPQRLALYNCKQLSHPPSVTAEFLHIVVAGYYKLFVVFETVEQSLGDTIHDQAVWIAEIPMWERACITFSGVC